MRSARHVKEVTWHPLDGSCQNIFRKFWSPNSNKILMLGPISHTCLVFPLPSSVSPSSLNCGLALATNLAMNNKNHQFFEICLPHGGCCHEVVEEPQCFIIRTPTPPLHKKKKKQPPTKKTKSSFGKCLSLKSYSHVSTSRFGQIVVWSPGVMY